MSYGRSSCSSFYGALGGSAACFWRSASCSPSSLASRCPSSISLRTHPRITSGPTRAPPRFSRSRSRVRISTGEPSKARVLFARSTPRGRLDRSSSASRGRSSMAKTAPLLRRVLGDRGWQSSCLRVGAAHDRRSIVARALAFRPFGLRRTHQLRRLSLALPLLVVLSKIALVSAADCSPRSASRDLRVSLLSYRFLEQPIPSKPSWSAADPRGARRARGRVSRSFCRRAVRLHRRPDPPDSRAWSLPTAPVPETSKKFLILGDSVAMSIGERLRGIQEGHHVWIAERGIGDCSIMHGKAAYALSQQGAPTTAVIGRKMGEATLPSSTRYDADRPRRRLLRAVQIEKKWQRPCDQGFRKAYGQELTPQNSKLSVQTRSHPPQPSSLIPSGYGPTRPRSRSSIASTTRCATSAKRLPFVTLVDLQAKLCPGGACATESDGRPHSPDALHFDGPGSLEISEWILAQVE